MPVRLITFDLDYTLWDATPALLAAEQVMHDWIATHSPVTASFYPPEKMREYRQWLAQSYPQLQGKVSELRYETLRRVFMQAGHDRDKARELAEGAFQAFFQQRSRGLVLYPGADEALRQLQQSYPLIAISNGNADLTLAGHDHYFGHHLNADQHGAAKPAPDMFEEALKRAGVNATECVHIGDHPEQDIGAAATLGIKTVWFDQDSKGWKESEFSPDAVFTHWQQLVPLLQALDD